MAMMRDQVWDLPPLRNGRPAPQSILDRRARLGSLAALHEEVPGVARRSGSLGGVNCHFVGSDDAAVTIVYFHGGGYRLGDPETWLGFAASLAARGSLRFILPEYRLAPEHPFPAAVHDAASVYRALRGAHDGPLILAGDSAGGGLASALVAAALANGAEPPVALILVSPWLDLSVTSPSYDSHAERDQMFSRASAVEAVDLYLQGASAEDALVSPLRADVSAFPPVQIFCGGNEVLIGDSLAFVDRLARANRDVEAHFVAGMQHVWPMIAPQLPEAAKLRDDVVRFASSFARQGLQPADRKMQRLCKVRKRTTIE